MVAAPGSFTGHTDRKDEWCEMRMQLGGSEAGGCESPRSSGRSRGAIARRSTILRGGTAAMALLIAQPASAISINDQVAAAAGGIANYYDAGNQFPNVVSLVNAAGSFCTGSLIKSRTY